MWSPVEQAARAESMRKRYAAIGFESKTESDTAVLNANNKLRLSPVWHEAVAPDAPLPSEDDITKLQTLVEAADAAREKQVALHQQIDQLYAQLLEADAAVEVAQREEQQFRQQFVCVNRFPEADRGHVAAQVKYIERAETRLEEVHRAHRDTEIAKTYWRGQIAQARRNLRQAFAKVAAAGDNYHQFLQLCLPAKD